MRFGARFDRSILVRVPKIAFMIPRQSSLCFDLAVFSLNTVIEV